MLTIMILGAGIYQVPAIVKAREMGLRTIVLSYLSDDPGLSVSDRGFAVDTTDMNAVLEVAKHEKIDGIMTIASEVSAPTVAYVASKLGLTGIGYKTAITISNKHSLRIALASYGIEGPRFREVSDASDVISFLNEVGGPAMIKPMNSSGSRGVAKIVDPSEAREKFERCLMATPKQDGILVEEYIDGIDIGGGCFVRNGEFVFCELTRKRINDYFVPIAHLAPVAIDTSMSASIKALVYRVMKALGITDGILDFDIRLGPAGPRLIELGGRLGGNCVPALLDTYTGVDLIKEGIKFSLGWTSEINVHFAEAFRAVRILGAGRSGRITKITNPEEIVPAEDIIESQIDYNVGDEVKVFEHGANRLGHVIFKSRTMEQADARICDLDKVFVVE